MRLRSCQQFLHSRQSFSRRLNCPRGIGRGERRRGRIKVLRRVTGPPESLERRLGERRDLRSELSGHGIFNCHVRAVAPGGAQSLPSQECFRGHPVSVVSSYISSVHVTTRYLRATPRPTPHPSPTAYGP